jgi:TRAP-type mannitol/chloroaromatic compound transport system substrate-binding protein
VFTKWFVPRLKEKSGGRLIIEPFGGDMIVRCIGEAYDAVMRGVLEGMQTSSAYWVGKEPGHFFIRAAVSPFTEPEQYVDWIWEGGGIDIAREIYARGGLYFVGPVMRPAESLHFTRRVTSIAEFKGMKVRTPAGPTAALFAAIGGTPVMLPAGEIYSALDKGLIDAAEWMGLGDNFGLGIAEVTDYFMWPSFHSPLTVDDFVLDVDVWRMLPDDLKVILETTVREWSKQQYDVLYLEDREIFEKYLAAGDTFVSWPSADWATIGAHIVRILEAQAAMSPLAAKAYKSQVDFAK